MTKEKLKRFVVMLGLVSVVVALPVAPVGAINVFDKGCNGNTDSKVCNPGVDDKGKKKTAADETIGPIVATIVNILLFAIGTVSVIMIIIGGIRYTTSNGDASQIKQAKDTILYSVIGLIVALLSFAIVNFVINQF